LVIEKNEWKVNSRGEQDRRREKLDDDKIPWVTKKFAGNCSGWRMTGGILLTVTRGVVRVDATVFPHLAQKPHYAPPVLAQELGVACFGLAASLPYTTEPRACLAHATPGTVAYARPPPGSPRAGPYCPRASPRQTAAPELHLHVQSCTPGRAVLAHVFARVLLQRLRQRRQRRAPAPPGSRALAPFQCLLSSVHHQYCIAPPPALTQPPRCFHCSCSPNAREPVPSARLKPSASLLRSAHARRPQLCMSAASPTPASRLLLAPWLRLRGLHPRAPLPRALPTPAPPAPASRSLRVRAQRRAILGPPAPTRCLEPSTRLPTVLGSPGARAEPRPPALRQSHRS
jgi:hypothetical protein